MTPAGFAHLASNGRWTFPRHLKLLNRMLGRVALGSVKRLLVTMPPRHGKSECISKYFPAWYLGTFPDRRVILTSYEADFAMTWGRKVRDLLLEFGPAVFGVAVRGDSTAANRWGIEGHPGGMDTAGVGGPITGKGAHLLVIDDPVKNSEEAGSETYRNKAWDWYASTAYTRLEPDGAVVLVQTRWHADDLAGRILASAAETGERWEVVNLPALAEPGDALGRAPGEPLWPERFDRPALEQIEATLGGYFFSSLYQQRPNPPGGGLFRREWFRVVDAAPADATVERVRFWDFASSLEGDYTVGARLARTREGLYFVEDVIRGRWSPLDRDRIVLQAAQTDGRGVHIVIEQEPGSSGLSVVDSTIRLLAGYVVHGERVTGDKMMRAQPFAAQCEAGNVRLVKGAWVKEWLDELQVFPLGKHDDQVDAASGSFNRLALAVRPGPAAVAGSRPSLGAPPTRAVPVTGYGYGRGVR